MKSRLLSNRELADLSDEWKNTKVDTREYYCNVLQAWEVDQETYDKLKHQGELCQEQNGHFYVA